MAIVGSPGCSTWPHLHFEVRDAGGTVVSPFIQGLREAPPVYGSPLSIMDVVITDNLISSTDGITAPDPYVAEISTGSSLGVGLSVADGSYGDSPDRRMTRCWSASGWQLGPDWRLISTAERLAIDSSLHDGQCVAKLGA